MYIFYTGIDEITHFPPLLNFGTFQKKRLTIRLY